MNASIESKTMYESQPAVSGLNRVSGFDPRKFLRKTVSEAKQEVLYLDLKYKKLWFRLAYPKGRIKKTALKITEQIAIIEARIFLDKDDTEPVSSFIAQRNAVGKPGSLYIEAAQYAAENQALIDAGFGIQFCDVSQGPDAEILDMGVPADAANTNGVQFTPVSGSVQTDIPANITQSAPLIESAAEAVKETIPPAQGGNIPAAETAAAENLAAQQNDDIPAPQTVTETAPAETLPADQPGEDTLPTTPQTITEAASAETPTAEQPQEETLPAPRTAAETPPAETTLSQSQDVPPVQPPVQETADTRSVETPAIARTVLELFGGSERQEPAAEAPSYTANMSVDEIISQMTPMQAAAVVVDNGICKGWTLAEVAEKRPASLKWLLNGYTGDNNILRAGANILLNLVMKKAG